ncbi:hypothetical protein PIB30_094537, partial [Stylosanthes scabra]|nr:hypothetical protein [Stylosanthes scabra]
QVDEKTKGDLSSRSLLWNSSLDMILSGVAWDKKNHVWPRNERSHLRPCGVSRLRLTWVTFGLALGSRLKLCMVTFSNHGSHLSAWPKRELLECMGMSRLALLDHEPNVTY